MVKIKTGKIGVLQKAIMLITTKPKIANLNIYKSFISFKLVKLVKLILIVINIIQFRQKPFFEFFRKNHKG